MRKIFLIPFILVCPLLFSCGSSETKTSPAKTGIDTLRYEEPPLQDSISVIDSLIAISATTPTTTDDSAALALKARLAADTLSGKIADSVKAEMLKAREYMHQKKNP